MGTSEYNSDSIFDSYNAEDEERDTCFVLAALTESKETLKMLVWNRKICYYLNCCSCYVLFKKSQCSESEESSNDNPAQRNADQVVKSLLKARLVYRILTDPIGNINVSATQMYSVRGFFLSRDGKKYQFLTQRPLMQYWRINPQVKKIINYTFNVKNNKFFRPKI